MCKVLGGERQSSAEVWLLASRRVLLLNKVKYKKLLLTEAVVRCPIRYLGRSAKDSSIGPLFRSYELGLAR